MTSGSGDISPLFTGVLNQREQRIAHFENAWFAGTRPSIEDFVPPEDDALRQQVLAELVIVDLECRLHAGDSARAEDYLGRFPDLAQDGKCVLQLLVHEFEIRQQRERVSLDEYADRFPQYFADLRARTSQRSVTEHREGSTVSSIRCPCCKSAISSEAWQPDGRILCPNCNEAIEMPRPAPLPTVSDSIVQMDKFELLEEAGRGAFGVVWRARDKHLDRIVAVKIPTGGRFMTVEEEDRFLREARSMAQLRHHGIVAVYDSGRCDGVPYIVAEFIEGTPLSAAIADRRFSMNEAAELIRRVARALDYAHQQGVVHRDLKPSNIMLDRQATSGSSRELANQATPFALDCEPRVMDFGLALRERGEATMTVDGQIVGTAAYMSPEQARGDSHHVDRRSDVYSVGVILYEMLAGETPFRGNLRMMLQQVLHEEPRPIRRVNDRVPRDLETISLKCLEKDVQSRYQSAGELADELERYLTDRPIIARPIRRSERAWRWCRRHPTVAALTAIIVAVVAIGFGSVTWQWLATKRAEHGRTIAQVDALLKASPDAIPTLISGLIPYRDVVRPVLREKLTDDDIGGQEKLRARLALLADGDSSQVESLYDALFDVDMKMFVVLRNQFLSCSVRLEDRLLGVVQVGQESSEKRFRAICYLAAGSAASRVRLKDYTDFATLQLITGVLANPSDYAALRDSLQPLAGYLIPALTQVYSDTNAAESTRRAAANLLADYARNEPRILARLLVNAEPWQMPILTPAIVSRHREAVVEHLTEFLNSSTASGNDTSLDNLAKQHANAAIALVQLGSSQSVWPLLAAGADMSARSYFIDRFARTGSKPEVILGELSAQSDSSIRRALYMALGGFAFATVPSELHASTKQALLETFVNDPDPGMHAVACWLLNEWGFSDEVDKADRALANLGEHSAARKEWYVNSQRHTMLFGGPAAFSMGSPPDEPRRHPEERLHQESINRKFAIAMCETTIDQFRRFDPQWRALGPTGDAGNCPVCFISWNQAAAYCNWLSQQEGIASDQFCYVSDPTHEGAMLEADNSLDKSGYRLPTEAEWEYACRAGTATARFFGHSAELWPKYAWCPANAQAGEKHPVGFKKPNDFGLFDIFGNADELCHDRPLDSPANYKATRGGAAGDLEPPRSALRNLVFNDPDKPKQGDLAVGFRVARTIDLRPDSSPDQ